MNGCASLVCLKEYLPSYIRMCPDDDDSEGVIHNAVRQIKKEIKDINCEKDYNVGKFNYEAAIQITSPTLLQLISNLIANGETTKQCLSLSQAIQYNVSKIHNQTTLGLAVKLHHEFGSKDLINILHNFGFTTSYKEVLHFKKCAAIFASQNDTTVMGLRNHKDVPISFWCDNLDLNTFTPNGTRMTHVMVTEFVQQQSSIPEQEYQFVIPNLTKSAVQQVKLSELQPIPFKTFQGLKKNCPPPPVFNRGNSDYNLVQRSHTSITSALQKDLLWLKSLIFENACEWSGFMNNMAGENINSSVTRYMFGPIIDLPPSSFDTVLTTLVYGEKVMQEHGMPFMHLSVDLQLYKIAMQIKWSDIERWRHLVVTPGMMHTLMSFVGCIGILMQGSGLEELLQTTYGGVSNMLNGKAWPKAVRGLRMVVATLLEDIILRDSTADDIEQTLNKIRETATGRLWVDCLITPVMILHMFIRSQREGDWLLELHCLKRMLPYFFAAGHWNYARYITWHIIEMDGMLVNEAKQYFLQGYHVCKHKSGNWNSVPLDQFGEQTYIRKGKARGGLVGISLSNDQVAGWVLSHHLCQMVSLAIDEIFNPALLDDMFTPHKEEGTTRQVLDKKDRKNIKHEFEKMSNPLKLPSDILVNIYNGAVADDKINVQNALRIGEQMAIDFRNKLPDGFNTPIKKEVTTMSKMKTSTKIGDKQLFNSEKIYARLLAISQHRNVDLRDLLKHDLAPLPLALFDDYGHMRKGNKSVLIKKLAVFYQPISPDIVLIDGNALIYHVQWPVNGTVKNFVQNFQKRIIQNRETYIIFDHYIDGSTKSHERERRANGVVTRQLLLTENSPLPNRNMFMASESNKRQLIELLCSMDYPNHIHLIGENNCLFGHEEADVLLISYTLEMVKTGKSDIQIISDDTDVFILLLFFFWKHKLSCNISMQKFNGEVININASASNLGDKCSQLLAFHALTGCDTVSFPYRKGKIAALKLLQNSSIDLSAFYSEAKDNVLLMSGNIFFSYLYGAKQALSMNELRYKIFTTKKDASTNLKNLPPTDKSIIEHFKRANLQVLYWLAADKQIPPNLEISKFGWKKVDNKCMAVTGGSIGPTELIQVIISYTVN